VTDGLFGLPQRARGLAREKTQPHPFSDRCSSKKFSQKCEPDSTSRRNGHESETAYPSSSVFPCPTVALASIVQRPVIALIEIIRPLGLRPEDSR
jgi:hypothetical protein